MGIWDDFRILKPDIKYLRLCWIDYSGILRTRIVMADYATEQLKQPGNGAVINVANATFDFPLLCAAIEGSTCVGEQSVIPDFGSLRVHPHRWRDSSTGMVRYETASVMCCILPQDNGPVLCPRTLLKQKIEALLDVRVGLEKLEVGFEIEFSILKQHSLDQGQLVPISLPHSYATSRLFQRPDSVLVILEEIVEALTLAGVKVLHFHSEATPGTYEVVTGHLEALKAVDTLIFSREVVQYVCAKHGYRATFLPKPVLDEPGVGSHAHISMEPTLSQWDFFGGVLHRLPLITAIAYGLPLSYARAEDGAWSGGSWAAWGHQNKEIALRLISEEKAHWEVKTLDGVGNMYLAMAAIFQGAAEGLSSGLKRHLGDIQINKLGCQGHPEAMSTEERQRVGITQKLPKSLEQGLDMLQKDILLKDLSFSRSYGERIIEQHIKIKQGELALFRKNYGGPTLEEDRLPALIRQMVWVAQHY